MSINLHHVTAPFTYRYSLFQYGLYASIFPGFVYALLGTCKEATVGPTAVNALMSYNYAGPNVVRAVTLAFLTGVVEIVAGMFKMGEF